MKFQIGISKAHTHTPGCNCMCVPVRECVLLLSGGKRVWQQSHAEERHLEQQGCNYSIFWSLKFNLQWHAWYKPLPHEVMSLIPLKPFLASPRIGLHLSISVTNKAPLDHTLHKCTFLFLPLIVVRWGFWGLLTPSDRTSGGEEGQITPPLTADAGLICRFGLHKCDFIYLFIFWKKKAVFQENNLRARSNNFAEPLSSLFDVAWYQTVKHKERL